MEEGVSTYPPLKVLIAQAIHRWEAFAEDEREPLDPEDFEGLVRIHPQKAPSARETPRRKRKVPPKPSHGLTRFGRENTRTGGLFELSSRHPAVREKRTLFPSRVKDPLTVLRVLVSGVNNLKVGRLVTKGRWKGFPIFTLTLEERATCSSGCHMWRGCMGNSMPFARRHAHGEALEERIHTELATHQKTHPAGFVVRLHILGDFYSLEYIALWEKWLKMFPALHVFGYTTRLPGTKMGDALLALRNEQWARFAMRFSRVAPFDGLREAVTVANSEAAKALNITICPAQVEKTETCGTCTFCWESNNTVAFIHHGNPHRGQKKEPPDP